MPTRDVAVLLFGIFVVFSAFGVTLVLTHALFGLPWSAIMATAAFMGVLKIVSEAPTIRLVSERTRLRQIRREDEERERRMRTALKKTGLLADSKAPKRSH
jgi:uncharacterized integral membrane protein